eukprot:c11041_g1_i1 orf=3-164(-)
MNPINHTRVKQIEAHTTSFRKRSFAMRSISDISPHMSSLTKPLFRDNFKLFSDQ